MRIAPAVAWPTLVASLCWTVQVTAATYYVRQGGSDEHSCEQAQRDDNSSAKATIQGGLSCPEKDTSGHTIIIHQGTYTASAMTEIFSSSRGESWARPNVLKAADGETVWLTRQGDVLSVTDHLNPRDGGGVRENRYWSVERINLDCQGGGGAGLVMDSSPYIRIQDSEIRDCRSGIAGCGDYNEFKNLHVHDIGNTWAKCQNVEGRQTNCYGIYCGASHVLIEGGSWHDMGLYCLHLYSGNYDNEDVTVRNAKVCRCGMGPNGSGAGIGIFNKVHRVTNNTLAGNAGDAIFASPGNDISGNTIYGGAIHVADGEMPGGNIMMAQGAGGDVCAYDGTGPSTPPAAGGKLPRPTKFRIVTK
jgi:hypothetical protein